MKPRISLLLPYLLGVLVIANPSAVHADKPANPPSLLPGKPVGKPMGRLPVLPAGAADEAVVKELLEILATTESEDTFVAIVGTLGLMETRDRRIIPVVIRAAEKVGALKGFAKSEEPSKTQQMIGDLLNQIIKDPEARVNRPAEEPAVLAGGVPGVPPPPFSGVQPAAPASNWSGSVVVPAGGLGAIANTNVEQLPAPTPGEKSAVLSMEDVVRMTQQGVSDEQFVKQIRSSKAVYHLTADDLIYFKQNGVHQAVINEMQATAYRTAR